MGMMDLLTGSSANSSLLWRMGLIDDDFRTKLSKNVELVGGFGNKLNSAFQVVAGAALIGFMDKLISRAGAIQDTADAFEMSTTSLQALDFTAKQAGVSADKLHGAYSILAGKSADLATGNKEVAKVIEALGINAQQFIAVPLDQKLEMIAKAYAGSEDKGKAFAAVADLIGSKNAPRLNTVLKQLADEGLGSVISQAEAAGQVLSESVIAQMDVTGDKVDALKDRLANWGTNALGKLFEFGEGIGYFAANIANLNDNIATTWAVEELGAKKTEAALERVNVAIRGTLATKEEIARATESQSKAEEAAMLAAMDRREKEAYWTEKIIALNVEKSRFDKESKEHIKIQNELLETQTKLNDEHRKQAEERLKKAQELAKASQLKVEESMEMIRLEELMIKNAGNLGEKEKARYDMLQLIAWKEKEIAEIKMLLDKRVEEGLTENEEKRLKHLVKAREETDKAIVQQEALVKTITAKADAEKKATNEVTAQVAEVYKLSDAWDNFLVKVTNKGDGRVAGLTDRQLDEKIKNLKAIIAQNAEGDPAGKYRYLVGQQILDLERAQDEKSLRAKFRDQVRSLGEERALGMYSAFDEERMKSYIREADELTKIRQGIEETNQRLAGTGKFPRGGFAR